MGTHSGEVSMPEDVFIRECLKYKDVLREYFSLAMKSSLNENEGDRLHQILKQAELEALLSFLLDEVDYLAAHELGLVDEIFIHQQQEALQRSIDEVRIEQLLMQMESCAKEIQTVLSSKGYYQGEIDGICGPHTQEAIRTQKAMKKLTKQDWIRSFIRELIDPQKQCYT